MEVFTSRAEKKQGVRLQPLKLLSDHRSLSKHPHIDDVRYELKITEHNTDTDARPEEQFISQVLQEM